MKAPHIALILASLLLPCSAVAVDANTGGSTTLRFEFGQAVVMRNGTELTRALVSTDAPVKGHPGVGNSAFVIVANCFAVVRELHDLTPTCHTPPMSLVELTTLGDGERKTTRFRWPKSFFQGTSLTSPAGDWGIVLSGRRATLDGYMIVRADGTHVAKPLDPPLDWSLSYGKVDFIAPDTAVFPSLKQGDATVSLVIHRTGGFDIVPLGAPVVSTTSQAVSAAASVSPAAAQPSPAAGK